MPKIKNISFLIILIYVKMLNFLFFFFLDLNKFLSILLDSVLSLSTILLLSILNAFEIKFDNIIIFSIEISSLAILLQLLIKH